MYYMLKKNNEFDITWMAGLWYPFSFYMPAMDLYLDSPVWQGTLCSLTFDYATSQYFFDEGSKYLKVPVLSPKTYEIKVYYFDKDINAFTFDHSATTTVDVLKDPLTVHIEVGKLHFAGEIVTAFIRTEVDGILVDVNELSVKLYREGEFLQELSWTKIDTGTYIAEFECPEVAGDYFVTASASKSYNSELTLYGSGLATFTVSDTLEGLNAVITSINENVADIITDVGEIQVSLSDLNGKIVSIQNGVVTIETDLGDVKGSLSDLNAKIVSIQDGVATIETDLGDMSASLEDLHATIKHLNGEQVVVQTDLGPVLTSLEELDAKVSVNSDKIATIETDLGVVKGKLVGVEGKIATIETDIGTIKVNTGDIKMSTGLQPASLGLSVIAAISAIAAAILILRKVYIK